MQGFWDKDRFGAFLEAEDAGENGVWHHLTDDLRITEGLHSLRMERLLI